MSKIASVWMKRYLVVTTLMAILVGVGIYFAVASSDANAESPVAVVQSTSPVSLAGEWKQSSSGIPNVVMTAEISGDSIKIFMKMSDTAGVFWMGSFNTSHETSQSFTVNSVGNVEAMKYDLYASSEKTKTFTYKDGDLSYQFSIMGVSTIVHLSRGDN
jgi:hypothetical protein